MECLKRISISVRQRKAKYDGKNILPALILTDHFSPLVSPSFPLDVPTNTNHKINTIHTPQLNTTSMDGTKETTARRPQKVRLGPIRARYNLFRFMLCAPIYGSVLISTDNKLVKAAIIQKPPSEIFRILDLGHRRFYKLFRNICSFFQIFKKMDVKHVLLIELEAVDGADSPNGLLIGRYIRARSDQYSLQNSTQLT